MGFNKRKMESERAAKAAKEAEARHALGRQVLEDAERLITTWNAPQEAHTGMLFAPTIGAAIAARRWFLWVRRPARRTVNALDLRTLDRHHDAAITSLIPWLSCRSCRPNAPFAAGVLVPRAASQTKSARSIAVASGVGPGRKILFVFQRDLIGRLGR